MARNPLFFVSLIIHGAIGVMIYRIDARESRAATSIQVSEQKKREVAKQQEAPKPPPDPPKRLAKRAPAAEKAEPPPAPLPPASPLETLPDFGLELSGSVGGIPVAAATTEAARPGPAQPRAVAAAPKRSIANVAAADGCDEPTSKPKPLNVPQPAYTDRAREAAVEGKVRVELTVDETGRVVSVRVLQGLGYGLDEAAVAAAERAKFEPALRCGKPARATFTISMRFSAQ